MLDFSRGMAGAIATMLLADYGADVVKVEHPAGDALAQGPAYRVWNRGKKGVVLDLKEPEAGSSAWALTEGSDIILESFRPGVADRLGIGYPRVIEANPGVIYCSISSYGPQGSWAQRHGYEGLVAAASGIMTEQMGVRDGPMFCSIPLAGLGASLLALQGILGALHVRNTTGRGQKVDTSMYQGAIAIRYPMLPRADQIPTFQMLSVDPQGGLPAYRMYPCGDSKFIHLGCLTREFWDKLAVALDLLELATEPQFEAAPTGWDRDVDREAAIALIGQRLEQRPRSHWLEVLEDADVPAAPVLTTQEYMDLPQVRHNGLAIDVNDPLYGEMEQVGLVIGYSKTSGRISAPAPRLGQHTREVLQSLGSWVTHTDRPGSGTESRERCKYPLEGLKVLDFSSFIAGPLGPMVLSDLGADVIKVEPVGGEGARTLPFLLLGSNRGKRGVAINIKEPASKQIIDRLLQQSDIVVHNMRVGVAERLGIDYETVQNLRPDVIYVHSGAYGTSGPDSLKPGFDPLFQSMSGTTARQGASTHRPVFLRTPVCDSANGMLLAVAALMALYHRDRTGQGQKIDVSLLNTAALVNSDDFVRYQGKQERPLADEGLHGLSALYRLYPTAEGWIFLACRQPKEWELLKKALGGAWLHSTIPFQLADAQHPWNDKLCIDLATEFAVRKASDWEKQLVDQQVPCVRVAENLEEGLFLNPQAMAIGAVQRKEHPEFSNLQQPGLLVQLSETPLADKPPAPLVGQHTREVLLELGFQDREIVGMESNGSIGMIPGDS